MMCCSLEKGVELQGKVVSNNEDMVKYHKGSIEAFTHLEDKYQHK